MLVKGCEKRIVPVRRLPARKFWAQLPIRIFRTSNHRSSNTSRITLLFTLNASTSDRTPGNVGVSSLYGCRGLTGGISPPDRAHSTSKPVHEDIILAIIFALPRSLVSSVIAAISSRSLFIGSRTCVRSDNTTPNAEGPRTGGSGYKNRRVEGKSEIYRRGYKIVLASSAGPSSSVCNSGRKPADRITRGVSITTAISEDL